MVFSIFIFFKVPRVFHPRRAFDDPAPLTMGRHARAGKEGFFPEKAGMASILACHAGYLVQLF